MINSVEYKMSFRVRRALERRTYSALDRINDEAFEEKNVRVQVIDWNESGNVILRLMSRTLAKRYIERKKISEINKERAQMWVMYWYFQKRYGYKNDMADTLFKFRNTLEELNGFHG